MRLGVMEVFGVGDGAGPHAHGGACDDLAAW